MLLLYQPPDRPRNTEFHREIRSRALKLIIIIIIIMSVVGTNQVRLAPSLDSRLKFSIPVNLTRSTRSRMRFPPAISLKETTIITTTEKMTITTAAAAAEEEEETAAEPITRRRMTTTITARIPLKPRPPPPLPPPPPPPLPPLPPLPLRTAMDRLGEVLPLDYHPRPPFQAIF